jgi:hypothetical protein
MLQHLAATSTSTSVPTLSGSRDIAIVAIVVGGVLLSGLVVILGRKILGGGSSTATDSSSSLVRSWIAISLVGGLLVFCAASFGINDPSLRSTLFGGLVASVGAAVAFYFSTKSADQARQDLLTATQGTSTVPDITGNGTSTVSDAQATLAASSLQLAVDDPSAGKEAVVKDQTPAANTQVRNGSIVTAITKPK